MKVRQDAWSHEDDLLLAETVLRHIREGSTQLNAFEEVGDALNRTSAACGFRWNAVVREKYNDAIKLAKKHRKQRKRKIAMESKPQYKPVENTEKEEPVYNIPVPSEEPVFHMESSRKNDMTLETVIKFLSTFNEQNNVSSQLIEENELLKKKLKDMEEAYSQLKKDYKTIEEDYQSIIQIMDRARKMAVLDDEATERASASFRMDKNGNLEKVAK